MTQKMKKSLFILGALLVFLYLGVFWNSFPGQHNDLSEGVSSYLDQPGGSFLCSNDAIPYRCTASTFFLWSLKVLLTYPIYLGFLSFAFLILLPWWLIPFPLILILTLIYYVWKNAKLKYSMRKSKIFNHDPKTHKT